jgi:hypothetical protein
VKSTIISQNEAQEIAVFFTDLTQEQVNNLVSGFFGIYTKIDTESQTLQNINRLLPLIWDRVDEDTRDTFGLKYGNFVANNFQHEKKLSRDFFQLVNAESYIPDDLRVVEIETAIDNLASSHRGFNNFYNEPTFARQLYRIVGNPPRLPKSLNRKYVYTIVEAFLTNGYGVAGYAEKIYIDLLSQLNSIQANIAVLSFNDIVISSKLQHDLCGEKFRELIEILKPIITTPVVNDIVEKIDRFSGRLENLKYDKSLMNSVSSLKLLLK